MKKGCFSLVVVRFNTLWRIAKKNKNGGKEKEVNALQMSMRDDSSSEEETHHKRLHHKLSSLYACLMERSIVEIENDGSYNDSPSYEDLANLVK